MLATRDWTDGPLVAGDAFPKENCISWDCSLWDDRDRLLCKRSYFAIPESGDGVRGINFVETTYDYDAGFRPKRVVAANGTITRTVYDTRRRVSEVWLGTDDTGATDTDPSGGGAAGNNMKKTVMYEYDGGSATGDSLVTKITRPVDDTSGNDRETRNTYDTRDRLVKTRGADNHYCVKYTYDNLDRVTAVEQYDPDDNVSTNLIAKREISYDNLGRMFKCVRRGVTIGTGATTDDAHSLRDELWYDEVGNLLKLLGRGRRTFQKFSYDGLNRPTRQYFCYDLTEYTTPTYAAAKTVTSDTVMHQIEWSYDAASNLIQQVTRQRFHSTTGTGPLLSATGTAPNARVSYVAFYFDALGRQIATADYGTNGAVAWTRSDTIPVGSDTVLLSRVAYNDKGEAHETTDPRGIITHRDTDEAGRLIRVIENYQPGVSGSDVNKTVEFAYDSAGRLLSITARNPTTGDQVTRFAYGVAKSTSDSDVARADLVKAMIYPDSDDAAWPLGSGGDDAYDRVEFRYNRQGQLKEKKDQAGTTHSYDYDKLGRWTQDRVTAFGTNIDQAVKRIGRTFEPRGRIEKVTSYDNATVGSGNVVNEIQCVYNNFRQLTIEYQEHAGAVNTGTSLKAQYAYSDGSNNTVRRSSFTYPNTATARTITYDYGTTDAPDDVLCRVTAVKEGATAHATYSYLGWERRVRAVIVATTTLDWTMLNQTGEPVGDAGDQYVGLDRFGRVEQARYISSSSNVVRTQYGFDRADNRTWRKEAAAPDSAQQDEDYLYDGLSQLIRLQRGLLNLNRTTATGSSTTSPAPTFQEDFAFDATGNWHKNGTTNTGAYVQSSSGTVQVNQNRLHNAGNEIVELNQSVGSWKGPVEHDAAGNLRKAPLPTTLTSSWTCTYDAWNRLVKAETTSPQGTYVYDGLDRRTAKTVGAGTAQHFYYSDQWQILERQDSATMNRQFLWGLRYPDDLLQRFRASGSESRYALHDYFHVTAAFNTGGAPPVVSERFGYDAYGTSRVMTSSWAPTSDNLDWEFRFGAAYYDSETGLYLMRYRYLHPKLGRWTSRDPLPPSHYNTNEYAYVSGNATSSTDPLGLLAICRSCIITLTCTYRDSNFTFPRPRNPVSAPTGKDCLYSCTQTGVSGLCPNPTPANGTFVKWATISVGPFDKCPPDYEEHTTQ
jgi:RHS repeat-associated protein